jgi:hypothetical protein
MAPGMAGHRTAGGAAKPPGGEMAPGMAGLRHERSEVELPGIALGGGSILCSPPR